MTRFLCIDIGTSRVKAALLNAEGALLALEFERTERTSSPDFQNAEEWPAAAARLIRRLAEKCTAAQCPDAVSVTGNMHALLGIDSSGRPVADAELWCSNAAMEESEFLNRRFRARLLEISGNIATPVFTLPKMLKMKRESSALYRSVKFFLQPKDYLSFRLTGNAVTDPSDASGTLLFSPDRRAWDLEFAKELGLDPGKLPDVLESASVCGRLSASAAAETSLPAGTPVVTGSGDLASAALGAGTDGARRSLTLGTAGQLLAAGERWKSAGIAGKLFVFAHADPERDLYLGSVPGGGFSLEWFARSCGLTMEEFFRLAADAPLSPDLPVFLPYLLGRGSPYMDYIPCAGWSGLAAGHTRKALCRAAVFGPLAALRESAEVLGTLALGKPDETPSLVLQALACREKAVRETACALFPGVKHVPENPEASLLGAGILASVALKAHPSFAAACRAMVHTETLEEVSGEEQNAAQILYRRYRATAENVLPV